MRYYLLDDLLEPTLDLAPIRLAIFLNAWRLRSAVRKAIASKLKQADN
eukprot:SAG31_NODE_32344_length_357_cov_0.790698_1_plen_47_part_10